MIRSVEFLEFAVLLAAQNRNEVARRSAVSRAYYAAFHLSRELLAELGVAVPANATGHEFIVRRLENCGCPEAAEAGSLLSDLRAERNRADYDLNDPRFEEIERVRPVIATASDFQQMLASLRNEPIRTNIREGIARYHQALRYSG